jgi:outer membrane protein TolC
VPASGGDAQALWATWADAPLLQLQQQALARNLDIAQARLRWERARLQQQAAGLDQGPTPSLGLSASGSRALERGPLTRSVGVSAGLAYEADLWGRLAQAERAQAAQAEAQQTDVAAAQLLIRSQVAEHYWSLAELAQEEPLIEAQRSVAAEVLALTRLRVQEGKLLPIEVDKAAATLQGVLARQAQLQRERGQHQWALRLLLDDAQLGLPTDARLPAPQLPTVALGHPEQVLARRPDVARARLQVDAALAQHRVAQAARYPRLSFSAGLASGGTQWQDWLAQPLATLTSNLMVPLVDWRRLDLQQAQARSDVDSAALALRDTVHKALQEVEQLAAERRELQALVQAQAARHTEAQRTERQARLRYEVGSIAKSDWLQVRNALLAAEQEALQLRLRQALNQASLLKALALG